jgi:hypothetical protein
LVVERIRHLGGDTYGVSVIYSWITLAGNAGFRLIDGMIGGDRVLRLPTFGNGRQVSYVMSPNRKFVTVDSDLNGLKWSGALWRAQQ